MKKLLILTLLLLTTGCTDAKPIYKTADIKGYYVQVERDWSGEVTDLSANPYAYLQITDDQLFFYTISTDEDEGYGISTKFYKLEDNKLYFDYYELKGTNWKENLDEMAGGIFYLSFNDDNLVLDEFFNDQNKDEGYRTNTYKQIDVKDWPIEE